MGEAPPQTEAAFQAVVLQTAAIYGWSSYHTRDSRGSQAGWPDLALWRNDRFCLRELKTDAGRLSPAQRATITSLKAAGVDVDVWRPAEWTKVHDFLRGRRW